MNSRTGSFTRAIGKVGIFAAAAALSLCMAAPALAASDGSQTLGATNRVNRLAGEDALATMQKITLKGFDDHSCAALIVATCDGYWDALTASGLAGVLDCPVLMTAGNELSSITRNEIVRLAATGGCTVYISGGIFAVSEDVENSIRNLACVNTVQRIAGQDAIDTSVATYKEGSGWGDTCIISTAGGYWDALAASPYAYAKHAPIFLSLPDADGLTAGVLDAIAKGGFSKVIITGGSFAVSNGIESQLKGKGYTVERLMGETAVDTSIAIARWCVKNAGMNPTGVGYATVGGYYDALAGASLCGSINAPVVLVSDDQQQAITGFAKDYGKAIEYAYVFGGPFAVSDSVYSNLANTLAANPYDPSVDPKDDIELDITIGVEPI